jgi:hypothetical protein
MNLIFISNFRRVLNVVFFLLGDSPASEFYVPTFRNTLISIFIGVVLTPSMQMEQIVPKRWHIKFRHRGITQKKEYNTNLILCNSRTFDSNSLPPYEIQTRTVVSSTVPASYT